MQNHRRNKEIGELKSQLQIEEKQRDGEIKIMNIDRRKSKTWGH